jgi:hypothetical protein
VWRKLCVPKSSLRPVKHKDSNRGRMSKQA